MKYYMIVNTGTFMKSEYAASYPRHLVLAQVLMKDAAYTGAVRRAIEAGTRVILDNGAHEGIDVDINSYLQLAVALEPWCVVLPDLVGRPPGQSRERQMDFYRTIRDRLPGETQYMYVGQGRTPEEALDDFDWASNTLHPDRFIIGLGQAYLLWRYAFDYGDDHEGARAQMIEEVFSAEPMAVYRYHVLGARWAPPVVSFSQYSQVIGIDTIKPCYCAHWGTTYPDMGQDKKIARNSRTAVDDISLKANVDAFCKAYGAIND